MLLRRRLRLPHPAIFHPTSRLNLVPACPRSNHQKRSNGSGDSYGVAFEYKYSVNGAEYTGARYTFDKTTSSDSAWARKAVADHPPGSQTTCYYDPHNPSRAVLRRGIQGSDITMLMFITPFNIIGGFLIAAPIARRLDRRPRLCRRASPIACAFAKLTP